MARATDSEGAVVIISVSESSRGVHLRRVALGVPMSRIPTKAQVARGEHHAMAWRESLSEHTRSSLSKNDLVALADEIAWALFRAEIGVDPSDQLPKETP